MGRGHGDDSLSDACAGWVGEWGGWVGGSEEDDQQQDEDAAAASATKGLKPSRGTHPNAAHYNSFEDAMYLYLK